MEQLGFWEVEAQSKVVNVSSVPQRSPFRYPGGKTWLIPQIRDWLKHFPLKPKLFIEPFAGGAIAGLTVAFENLAEAVILVEKDEQVAAVWKTILSTKDGADWLANEIAGFELTLESAKHLLLSKQTSVKKLALKTIVQNRISHGGILANGAGLIKNGEKGKGILSRWYPQTLRKRILDISKIKERIKFIQGDGFEIIKKNQQSPNSVFFVDPPYTASKKKAGSRLYKYHQIDHERLFGLMSKTNGDFLMTYDDAEEVRSLAVKYRFETRLISMNNTHHATLRELLIGKDLSWVDKS
ncbi:MAG TPA: DNA adenine methylase [Anaerolineales bacterium]|nr:DNA adenine methylase [Anaerolineales bacterium]